MPEEPDEITAIEIMPPKVSEKKPPPRRRLASILRKIGSRDIYVAANGGEKMPYERYLAIILWDLAVTGEAVLADGKTIQYEEYKDWLDTVKFLASHMDGPATLDPVNVNVANIFKVYAGFDPDKV